MKHRTTSLPSSHPEHRRIAFTLVMLSVPVLFFLFSEAILRATGFGPNLSLFVTETVNGQPYLVMNPAFASRYFARVPFHPQTAPDYFLEPKPPGTFRIFCLGGSTTAGFPYGPVGAFPSFLADRVTSLFPEKSIEVINLGVTATNSFTVADIMREIGAYEPDLVIVYDGHNEFYGALGVSSRESIGQSRWITKTYLRLIHSKVFLLLRDLTAGITRLGADAASDDPGGTMMEKLARGQYVAYRSPAYDRALDIFKENLAEIAADARDSHVPLILGTQVSNLRDLPPFFSVFSDSLPSAQRLAFTLAYNAGMTSALNGRWQDALSSFRDAAALDQGRADAQFQTARCLDTLGHKEEARAWYFRARDLDRLRFRAAGDFNEAIRRQADTTSVFVADMEEALGARAPAQVPGGTLILEHLHPNLRGSFLLAKEYARVMAYHGILAPSPDWARRDTIGDESLWARRGATALDERIADRRIQILTSGWPFRDQNPIVPAVADTDTLGQIAEQVTRGRWTWERAHEAALEFEAGRNDIAHTEAEYRVLLHQFPLSPAMHARYGAFLAGCARVAEAKAEFQSSLRLRETALAYRGLGNCALGAGHFPEAMVDFQKSLAFTQSPQEQAGARVMLSLAFLKTGDKPACIAQLQEACRLDPSNRQARTLLQQITGR